MAYQSSNKQSKKLKAKKTIPVSELGFKFNNNMPKRNTVSNPKSFVLQRQNGVTKYADYDTHGFIPEVKNFGAIAAKMWCALQSNQSKATTPPSKDEEPKIPKERSFRQKREDYINDEMAKYETELLENEAFIEAWERENPDDDEIDELWDEMVSTYEPTHLEFFQELSCFIPIDNNTLVPYSVTFGGFPGPNESQNLYRPVLQATM